MCTQHGGVLKHKESVFCSCGVQSEPLTLNQTKTYRCLLVGVYERAGKNLGAHSQCLCGSGHVGLSGDALN